MDSGSVAQSYDYGDPSHYDEAVIAGLDHNAYDEPRSHLF